jgi:hypothetical protein
LADHIGSKTKTSDDQNHVQEFLHDTKSPTIPRAAQGRPDEEFKENNQNTLSTRARQIHQEVQPTRGKSLTMTTSRQHILIFDNTRTTHSRFGHQYTRLNQQSRQQL